MKLAWGGAEISSCRSLCWLATMRASVERHEGPGWKRGQGARGAQAVGLLFTDFQKNVETVH